jgi:Iap family predicted aminopeptidase
METKTQYIKRLRTELRAVGTEIEQQIVQLDKLSGEIKQGYEELETALEDKQALAQAKLREASMSGNEVWDLVWDNVWDALKEFNRKATTEIKHDYKELEPALRAKQSALQKQLPESALLGDEIWDEVWNEVWRVGEEFNSKAAIEIKQVGEELQALLDKQLAVQSKLHEILVSGDKVWNVVKEVTNAMVKGTSR